MVAAWLLFQSSACEHWHSIYVVLGLQHDIKIYIHFSVVSRNGTGRWHDVCSSPYTIFQMRVSKFFDLLQLILLLALIIYLGPIEAPLLKVIDMIGFEEIALKWTEISKADARGEVLGYHIQYWLSELHENPVIQSTKYSFEILEPNRTAMITGLQAFAQYRIRILAFNEGGFGIWSQEYGGGISIEISSTVLIVT